MMSTTKTRLIAARIALLLCLTWFFFSPAVAAGDQDSAQTPNAFNANLSPSASGQSTNTSQLALPPPVPAENNRTNQSTSQTDFFPVIANNSAWSLATSPEATNRNGALAIELAKYACERTHYREVMLIGTLAAAYAEAGRFDEAIATAQKACDLASQLGKPELVERNQQLLALYRAHQPYHEVASPGQTEESRTNNVRPLTINNIWLRRDTAGEIIDAHDGCLQFFNGRFYLYGTSYGTSDRFSLTNHYRVYSSPDLGQWTYEGELLRGQPSGVYYRPYVVFNSNTRKYVLWYNWYPKLWDGQTGAATSDTPVGPFTIINSNVHLSKSGSGDGSLFVDDDGTGYFIYTSIDEDHTVCVERLKPDYLRSTGETSSNLTKNGEAPLLFRQKNTYYALCASLCMACPNGSQVSYYTATSPLGPYTMQSYINGNSENYSRYIPAQETWVARISTSEGPVFVWMADCWESSADGVNGHDLQYWTPLEFSPDGEILPIRVPRIPKPFHFAMGVQPESHSK